MRICSVEGCGKKYLSKGYCKVHYTRLKMTGSLEARFKRPHGTGNTSNEGYLLHRAGGIRKYQHVLVAEKALGRPLPKGVVVHHVDENTSNNDPCNLVICQDQAYHALIHKRTRAYEACGNADWVRCKDCHQYDDPKNMHQVRNCNAMRHKGCQRNK